MSKIIKFTSPFPDDSQKWDYTPPTEDTPNTCPHCPTGFHSTDCPYKKQELEGKI